MSGYKKYETAKLLWRKAHGVFDQFSAGTYFELSNGLNLFNFFAFRLSSPYLFRWTNSRLSWNNLIRVFLCPDGIE